MVAVLFAMSLATWLQGPAATDPNGLPAFAPGTAPAETPDAAPTETAAATTPATPAPAPTPTPAPQPTPAPAPGAHPYLVGGFGAPDEAPPQNRYVADGGGSKPAPKPMYGPKSWGRFVFAILPSLTFGISSAPSVNGTMFFGGRLRSGKWAVGYAPTLSLGLAERYTLGIVSHRHHVMALHNFKDRGFASVGAGLGFFYLSPALVEAEGRVGVRLGKQRYFVIGGMMRLGYNFFFKEKAPLPQFGGFLGWSFL